MPLNSNVLNPAEHPRWRAMAALSIVSGSLIALQVVFTRLFSIMIWHHFTYLVIGVALLGGGAAGTFLAVRRWSAAVVRERLGLIAAGYGVSVLAVLIAIALLRFDPLKSAQVFATLMGLTAYFGLLFSVFFLGGLTVAGTFSVWARDAHRLYFADLAGAGLGALVAAQVIETLGGVAAMLAVGLCGLLAAALFGGTALRRWRWAAVGGAVVQVALLLTNVVWPLPLAIPESKELGWALRQYGFAAPELTRWNPVARVDVLPEITVPEPMIVGGLAEPYRADLLASGAQFPLQLVTLDGTSMTGIYKFDGDFSRFDFLKHAIISAPFQIGIAQPRVLNIGVGGGLDILQSHLFGASQVKAIELNPDVVALLTGPYKAYSGNLVDLPNTELIVAEGRSALLRDTGEYDIIQGIGLDNFAALSGGAYVLAESYLYTVESVDEALARLSPQGVFAWTRDDYDPPREMLRLAGLGAEALRRRGETQPWTHILIVSNASLRNATLLISREPFSAEAVERARTWASENGFVILADPLTATDTTYSEYLRASDPRAFEAQYPYQIAPVTDDNPFFYNYYRIESAIQRDNFRGGGSLMPLGNLILLTLIVLSTLTAALFIVLPLWRNQRAGLAVPLARRMLVYFGCLGAGYIFIEIIMIQRYTLFIGYPTVATTTTIFSLLVFSGIGSLLGRRWATTAGSLRVALAALVALTLIYNVALPPIFTQLMRLPDLARIAFGVVLLAPLGLLMGMPFPAGINQLGTRAPDLVAWAWGVNGVISVLGSAVVILVSQLSNFTLAGVVAAVFYGVAWVVCASLWRISLQSTAPAGVSEGQIASGSAAD